MWPELFSLVDLGKDLAVKAIKLGMRGLRARDTHKITLGCIQLHAPGVPPLTECGQGPLQGNLIFPALYAMVDLTVNRKESDLCWHNMRQVAYMQKEEQGTKYRTLGHPRVHRRTAREWPLTCTCCSLVFKNTLIQFSMGPEIP